MRSGSETPCSPGTETSYREPPPHLRSDRAWELENAVEARKTRSEAGETRSEAWVQPPSGGTARGGRRSVRSRVRQGRENLRGKERRNAHHHVKMVLFAILGVDVNLRRRLLVFFSSNMVWGATWEYRRFRSRVCQNQREISSVAVVHTRWPFFPMMMALPVSWHPGGPSRRRRWRS